MITGKSPSGPSELLMINSVAIVRVSPTVTADWLKVGAHEIVSPALATEPLKITTAPIPAT
jgi:hypothetical protein